MDFNNKKIDTRDMISSQLNNGQMVYNVYDASGRLSEVYEAPLFSVNGNPCLKTIIKYIDGAAGTSRVILATKESLSTWNSSWDADSLP